MAASCRGGDAGNSLRFLGSIQPYDVEMIFIILRLAVLKMDPGAECAVLEKRRWSMATYGDPYFLHGLLGPFDTALSLPPFR